MFDNTTVQDNNAPVPKPWEMATNAQIRVIKNKCAKYCKPNLKSWNDRYQSFEAVLQHKLTRKAAKEILDITGVNMFSKWLPEEDEIKLVNLLKSYLLI